MLPGSIASSAVIWCVGGNGHSAIEFCVGDADCHETRKLSGTNAQRNTPDRLNLAPRHEHGDCTDVGVVSTTATVSARNSGDIEASPHFIDDQEDTPILARLSSQITIHDRSRRSRADFIPYVGFIDPNILSRRLTVLRI